MLLLLLLLAGLRQGRRAPRYLWPTPVRVVHTGGTGRPPTPGGGGRRCF